MRTFNDAKTEYQAACRLARLIPSSIGLYLLPEAFRDDHICFAAYCSVKNINSDVLEQRAKKRFVTGMYESLMICKKLYGVKGQREQVYLLLAINAINYQVATRLQSIL